MKKSIVALALLTTLPCAHYSFALSTEDISDKFKIRQHRVSLGSSYDMETKTQKLGTLHQKFFHLPLTYEFFDPDGDKLATARSKFFSFTAHFDIYDIKNNLLGVAQEKLFAFYPTFEIYAKDASTKLAKAQMNFWGTTFSIYDPEANQKMATIHRSFFGLKKDWTFKVINSPLFNKINIDPRVLLTIVAFQGDREDWESIVIHGKYLKSMDKANTEMYQQITMLLEKINNLYKLEGLSEINNPDTLLLETIAKELETNYTNNNFEGSQDQTDLEKLNDFTDYYLKMVQSNGIPSSQKKAILHLLRIRLERAIPSS